jgi:parallel beta-helix repeat protein
MGNNDTDTTTATIEGMCVDAHGPYAGIVGVPVQFNGSVFGGYPDYQWRWDFGDGDTSTEQNPQYNYSEPGTYPVNLTVTDSKGNTDTDSTQAIIVDELVVYAHGPYYGIQGEPIHFIGSASGGFSPYTWSWDFGDDSEPSYEQNPMHNYTSEGEYVATLTVTDFRGTQANDTALVTIRSRPSFVWVDHNYYDDDHDGGHDWGIDAFDTIQEGISHVALSGTVYVANGTYHEAICIEKPLVLMGEHPSITLIEGTIDCSYTTNVAIRGFTILSNDWYGIEVVATSNIMVTDTLINLNNISDVGMYLISSNNVTISKINIQNSGLVGIYLFDSSNVSIINNTIANNPYGLFFLYLSNNNTVTRNTITGNGIGISVGTPWLEEPTCNNMIYHNNFIDNTVHAYNKGANMWNTSYPDGGNYWSGYSGDDNRHGPNQMSPGGDGIIDTAYEFDDGAVDHYPFAIPDGWINSPPDTPRKPAGPRRGTTSGVYTYTTSTTDPEGYPVYYNFSWGDGTFSGWLGPYPSGEPMGASHRWATSGIYKVMVTAQDTRGFESDWSQPVQVRIFNAQIEVR